MLSLPPPPPRRNYVRWQAVRQPRGGGGAAAALITFALPQPKGRPGGVPRASRQVDSQCALQRCSRVRRTKVSAESTVLASNSAARHCNPQDDALLRWGLTSFFTGAPQALHGSATLACCCPRAVCARSRTVLMATFEPAHDLGLCARLLFELHALMCGLWACVVAVKSAVVAIAHSALHAP